jgi:hypothetical protein
MTRTISPPRADLNALRQPLEEGEWRHEFARLVKYLVNGQDKFERVGELRVTNCYSDELVAGVLETLNTQARNTRAGPDRTYHLILSFRAGEEVDSETLSKIEERVCDALGPI